MIHGYRKLILVDVGASSLALMLLGNHLLSWGLVFFLSLQGDRFWEVGVSFVNTFQC